MAIGLGELHGQPALGSRLELSISILGQEKEGLDTSCFRLVRPSGGDDLPWLKQAELRLVPGKPAQLKIASQQVMRDPVMRLAVHLACGHEVNREYTILASPSIDAGQESAVSPAVAVAAKEKRPAPARRAAKSSTSMPGRQAVSGEAPSSAIVSPKELARPGGDQLLVSAADIDGDLPLRVSPLLREQPAEASETQREMLRLEFRMLQALHEQAGGQLEMAEKLRAMEGALAELQGRALSLTESASESKASASAQAAREAAKKEAVEEESSAWWFYGLLLGVVLVLGGWLFVRNRQGRRAQEEIFPNAAPEQLIDAPRKGELDENRRKVDLPLDAPLAGTAQKVDVELAGGAAVPPVVPERPQPRALPGDSVLSINATTLDEHFEANPVMELADIMLSFGRVKGAAQALQEYIDNNPQEALQPWIRLMDVYRMAGMREEFEAVARNLNQHFNVEVQSWSNGKEAAEVDLMLDGGDAGGLPASASPTRAQALEDMPRIIGSVIKMWDDEDVVGYLYELLRDNRGGQRQGFSLPVVEDILFLIELKETANRMEKEGARGV